MIGIICIHIWATFVYAAVSTAFYLGYDSQAYIVLFVASALEVILNIAITVPFKVVSFEGSHLAERLNLLTLIILGEGWPIPDHVPLL